MKAEAVERLNPSHRKPSRRPSHRPFRSMNPLDERD